MVHGARSERKKKWADGRLEWQLGAFCQGGMSVVIEKNGKRSH